jgi:glycosyltransferase involved in cell wall biosynthesis
LVAIVLPAREDFCPQAAGAISLVVQRFCAALPGAVVLGTPRAVTFPDVAYEPVTGAFGIWKALRRLKPVVIEVHQQPRLALALAYLFPRARVMLVLHNDPLTMRGLRTGFGRRWVVAKLHRVVCVSAFLAGRFGAGAVVLPNPLTLAALPRRAETRSPVILYAGRITVDKAPDVFIAACAEALPQLPGWRAVMIGGDRFGPSSPETPYVTRMREAAAAAGVAFLGPRPHAEVLEAMAAAAIVVVPSRWAEPFGLTALEAMASGAALVTTGNGALREVAGEAALYVTPEGLGAALVGLARDEPARGALAAAGLARAAAFDTSVVVARLEGLRSSGDILYK